METQKINLTECCALITAENVMLNKSSFSNASMRDISISDADLSDMVIDGAQIGGAKIMNSIDMYNTVVVDSEKLIINKTNSRKQKTTNR